MFDYPIIANENNIRLIGMNKGFILIFLRVVYRLRLPPVPQALHLLIQWLTLVRRRCQELMPQRHFTHGILRPSRQATHRTTSLRRLISLHQLHIKLQVQNTANNSYFFFKVILILENHHSYLWLPL